MNDNVLIHYGKLGMKWGRHKTSARNANRIGTNQLATTRGGVDAARGGVNSAKDINSTIGKARAKKKVMDVSTMSDKELQETINRMSMEQRYSDLAASKNVSKGHANVDSVLSVAGGVLGVASSAVGIAVAIKTLKG